MAPQRDDGSCEERARALLHEIADLMAEQHTVLTDTLTEEFIRRIPELHEDRGLQKLLRASTASNLENVVHLLRGHVPLDDIQVPAAAAEYARRLAQRGISASALLRAYRLGQQQVLGWGHDRVAERESDHDVAIRASRILTQITFSYIDAVSEGVVTAYQVERERWLANRSTVQRETAEAVVRGDEVDVAAVESALGYRVRQHHVGVLLWHDAAAPDTADLGGLERALGQVARSQGADTAPLFVPRDRGTGWGWVPLGRAGGVSAEDLQCAVAPDPGVCVAVGRPGSGLEGFRTTHLEAVRAHRVATLGGSGAGGVTSYGEAGVRAAGLLAADMDATQRLVTDTLGDLALDTEVAGRLRETLLAFLGQKDSYVATAEIVHLHKNTVKYRVDQAVEARGRPLDDDRLDLELALIACRWLGPEVLRRSD